MRYDNADHATFDLDRDMARHMSVDDETFKLFGIEGWRVLKAVGAPIRGKPAYSVTADLEFDTTDQFRAAVAVEGDPVFRHVPNFSDGDPVVVVADLVGAAS